MRERQEDQKQQANTRVLCLEVKIPNRRALRSAAIGAATEIQSLEDLGYELRQLKIHGYLLRQGKG